MGDDHKVHRPSIAMVSETLYSDTDLTKNHHLSGLGSFADDPTLEHPVSIPSSTRKKRVVGFHRTNEEVDRLWEYNKMMGKR